MEFYSDNELLSRIAEGDERAFSALYYRYDTMLYVFLMKLTRSEAAAEELLQETFLRLWLYRDSLSAVDHPRAYIHHIAADVSHRWLQCPDATSNAGERLAWRNMEALVARIISEMPEQRTTVYQLHRDEGLTPADIASQVGVTASTVRNTIAAAIRQIRERLLSEGYSLVLILFFLLLCSRGAL